MKNIFFRMIAFLIGCVFVLASLELLFRFNPKLGYRYSFFKFLNNNSPITGEINKFHRMNVYRPSSLFGYEHIPNQPPFNSYGLISRESELQKSNDTFRIVLLGDSIAEQNWSAIFLEEALNNNSILNKKYRFEIWNAGVGGYDAHHYAIYLQRKGLSFKPDMVMVFLFMNDFSVNTSIYYKNRYGFTEYNFSTADVSKKYTINPFLMKHSYLYRFLILRLNSYLLSKKRAQGINPDEENGMYYMQMIKEICNKNNIPLFIIVFPYLKPWEEYKDYQINEYKTIFKVIGGLKMYYLNLYEYLDGRDLHALRNVKEDEIHPSEGAHRLIANIIYDYLLGNFFIK